jgi:sialic acid synthase SpsE
VSLIILDMGSGNGQGNDIAYQKKAIDTVAGMDSKKHQVILKYQLEIADDPPNKHLDRDVFGAAYHYGLEKGYAVASSVFDESSLDFLLGYITPFIKIACRPDLYPLIQKIAPRIAVMVSVAGRVILPIHCMFLHCIPKYPAEMIDYEATFAESMLKATVSDHVQGLQLWNKYHPAVWEKHFVLERDAGNPDAGPFAVTPDQLKEVIG